MAYRSSGQRGKAISMISLASRFPRQTTLGLLLASLLRSGAGTIIVCDGYVLDKVVPISRHGVRPSIEANNQTLQIATQSQRPTRRAPPPIRPDTATPLQWMWMWMRMRMRDATGPSRVAAPDVARRLSACRIITGTCAQSHLPSPARRHVPRLRLSARQRDRHSGCAIPDQ